VLERAVILSTDDLVTAIDLPVELRARTAPSPPRAQTATHTGAAPVEVDSDLDQATLAFQKIHIARVLDSTDGNRELAAKLLGLSPATFYRYLQKVGLKGYRAPQEERRA
jgi:DNA-binding NtrC family response regulator